jgi:hypothetical protein
MGLKKIGDLPSPGFSRGITALANLIFSFNATVVRAMTKTGRSKIISIVISTVLMVNSSDVLEHSGNL